LQSGCKDNALFAAFPNLFFNYFVKKCQSPDGQMAFAQKKAGKVKIEIFVGLVKGQFSIINEQ